jgi:transcriptional regulator with XRE-family HTH domain
VVWIRSYALALLCSAPDHGAESCTNAPGTAPSRGAEHRTHSAYPGTAHGISTAVNAVVSPSTGAAADVDHAGDNSLRERMSELNLARDAMSLVAEVGRALRKTRRRRGLSQREFAQQLGVSKSRLARLESDAGPQSLEMVSQVLLASGFRLEVIDALGTGRQEVDALSVNLPELYDASGRHFPAHLEAHPLPYPPMYWFVRNGGWNTSKAFPQWTYERRFVPRAPPRSEAGTTMGRGNAGLVLLQAGLCR